MNHTNTALSLHYQQWLSLLELCVNESMYFLTKNYSSVFSQWENGLVTTASCARGDTVCLRAPCKLTLSSHLFARWRRCSGITISFYLFARWHLFRHVGSLRHQQQVDLWAFDLESGVRVMCDVGYLCANFSLPRPLRSRVRPDVRDRQTSNVRRQTDVRQKHRLMPPPYRGGGITTQKVIEHRITNRYQGRIPWWSVWLCTSQSVLKQTTAYESSLSSARIDYIYKISI